MAIPYTGLSFAASCNSRSSHSTPGPVQNTFSGSHGTLVAVSAPFMMPLRDSDIPMNAPFTLRNKQPLTHTFSTEQLQVQDYWDRIIGTETTVKSVITFYVNTFSSNPINFVSVRTIKDHHHHQWLLLAPDCPCAQHVQSTRP
jgi:hypothetical protein